MSQDFNIVVGADFVKAVAKEVIKQQEVEPKPDNQPEYESNPTQLFTTIEVALFIRKTPQSVRAYCNQGLIKYRLVGRQKMIQGSEITKYLSANE